MENGMRSRKEVIVGSLYGDGCVCVVSYSRHGPRMRKGGGLLLQLLNIILHILFNHQVISKVL